MIPITGSATPLRENYGVITGAVIVFRDDTQKRLVEERNLANERTEQIAEQMAELQRLDQLKEDFLTVTSHEMRTPLSNIKMAISMLENVMNQQDILSSTTSPIPESVSRYLGILRYECERELNLVDDLLNIQIIDAANYPLELTSIPIQHWLPKMVDSFQKIAQVQKQVLEVSISSYLPPLVSDLNLVTRIVSELLMNACKYTPARERITVTLNLSQTPKTFSAQDHEFALEHNSLSPCFQLRINNSGIEIPLAYQSRIFEPFYCLPQSKTQEQLSVFEQSNLIPHSDSWQASGTGLGLTLVKKLVEYLQGTIEVTSSYGLTSFIIQLPLTISVNK